MIEVMMGGAWAYELVVVLIRCGHRIRIPDCEC